MTFKSEHFSYTIYSSRFPSAPVVGLTFKPAPSLSLAELHSLITDLQRVHEYMKQGEAPIVTLKKWTWDSIGCEIQPGPAGNAEGWKYTKTYPNGVREYRTDREHVGLECEATTKEEAHNKFAHYSEEFVEVIDPEGE